MYEPSKAYRELLSRDSIDAESSEAFQEDAVRSWIAFPQQPFPVSKDALQKLARAAWKNHHDAWLGDFLAAPFSLLAVKRLQAAIAANYLGDPEQAMRDAIRAADLFQHAGNFPGEARSRFELVFASQRKLTIEKCLQQVHHLQSKISGKNYTWLEVQLSIEMSICEGMEGDRGSAWRLLRQSDEEAQRFHYPVLDLRALGMQAGQRDADGQPNEARSIDERGLDLFREGVYPGLRAFQFFSDMAWAAREARQWRLARDLQREVLDTLNERQNDHKDLQGFALFLLGTAEKQAGDAQAAYRHFQKAFSTFHELPDTITTRAYIAESEIKLAAAEVSAEDFRSAEQHLRQAAPLVENLPSYITRLDFLMSQAQVERSQQNLSRECDLLHRVIQIGNQGFRTLRTPADRWDWRQKVGAAYLRLLEIKMEVRHDEVQALADWETFRMAASSMQPSVRPNQSIQAKKRLQELAGQLHDRTLLTFASSSASERTHVWLADDRLVREFSLPVSSKDLWEKVQQFYKLCSNAQASRAEITRLAKELYGLLFSPLENYLDPKRLLVIEPDELFSALPWSALMLPDGRYLCQVYALAETPGLFYATPKTAVLGSERDTRTLIVLPGAVTLRGERLSLLSGAADEAQTVFAITRNPLLLNGTDANLGLLLKQLPGASIVHFAGHAIGLDEQGELVLAGEEGMNTLSARNIEALHLRHCRLVVLSACSTAKAKGDITLNPEGLVQAFLSAGAGSVVASHWDVDSGATNDLMKHFYQYLAQGETVGQALSHAKQHLISQQANSAPYYWAAFEVFGSAKTLMQSTPWFFHGFRSQGKGEFSR